MLHSGNSSIHNVGDDATVPQSSSTSIQNVGDGTKMVPVPYNDLRQLLLSQVEDWFWDKEVDPDTILEQYNQDGTRKNQDATREEPDTNEDEKMWRLNKLHLRRFEFHGVKIHRLLWHMLRSIHQELRTNPYNLHSIWYLLIFFVLNAWAIGSIVVGHYEARAVMKGNQHGYLATMGRGIVSALPALVQVLFFLFPPLWVSATVLD